MALAGRAGEELVYGREEMSSLHQSRNMLARQIATKMQNAGEGEGEREGRGAGGRGGGVCMVVIPAMPPVPVTLIYPGKDLSSVPRCPPFKACLDSPPRP